MEEYIFRYRLDKVKEPVFPSDPVLEMVRLQLEAILNVVIPMEGEREARIDGFKLLRDRGTIYKVFPRTGRLGDGLNESSF